MKKAQQKSYVEGNRIGIKKGKTPEQQAREDRKNPNLKGPFRAESSQGQGTGSEKKE